MYGRGPYGRAPYGSFTIPTSGGGGSVALLALTFIKSHTTLAGAFKTALIASAEVVTHQRAIGTFKTALIARSEAITKGSLNTLNQILLIALARANGATRIAGTYLASLTAIGTVHSTNTSNPIYKLALAARATFITGFNFTSGITGTVTGVLNAVFGQGVILAKNIGRTIRFPF